MWQSLVQTHYLCFCTPNMHKHRKSQPEERLFIWHALNRWLYCRDALQGYDSIRLRWKSLTGLKPVAALDYSHVIQDILSSCTSLSWILRDRPPKSPDQRFPLFQRYCHAQLFLAGKVGNVLLREASQLHCVLF